MQSSIWSFWNEINAENEEDMKKGVWINHKIHGKGRIIGFNGKVILVKFLTGKELLFKYPDPNYEQYFTFCDVNTHDLYSAKLENNQKQTCPICGERVVRRQWLFYKCNNCNYTRECYNENVPKMSCPQCVWGELVLKKTRFYGCVDFPDCNYVRYMKTDSYTKRG